jgi:hypothetical protein
MDYMPFNDRDWQTKKALSGQLQGYIVFLLGWSLLRHGAEVKKGSVKNGAKLRPLCDGCGVGL